MATTEGGIRAQRQGALQERAQRLLESRKFQRALSLARADWNQGHIWKVGVTALPVPTTDVRWRLAPEGLAGATSTTEVDQEWAAIVDRLCREHFPGWPVDLRHPAWPWVNACLLAGEAKPSEWIVVERPEPQYHHPYSAHLEKLVNATILELRAGDEGSRELAVRLTQDLEAAQAEKYAWAFVPHFDNSPEGRQHRAQLMRSSGATHRKIAAALGVSERQVRRWPLGPRGSAVGSRTVQLRDAFTKEAQEARARLDSSGAPGRGRTLRRGSTVRPPGGPGRPGRARDAARR
jgi:hypothetical protein